MTSLQRQLEGVRTAASSQFGVERCPESLLFDTKQAASLYRENFFKIGQSGLSQLRKIDPTIANNEAATLFDEAALSIERSLLSNADNENLNAKIELLLAQISPYFQHFAAQQVLEWMIYKFQIHEFNAERVFITFLPFHTTKIFGRLIASLRLKGTEYDWVRQFAKSESPISLEAIIAKCFSVNHSILSLLHQHIEHLCKLIGAEEMESRMPQLFSFYATLCVHLVSDAANLNDSIISKILPFLGTALKSQLVSLRLSALMTTCQLCVSVTLSGAVINSLLKLVLLKLNESSVQQSINTAIVICQHQDVTALPVKAVKKLAGKNSLLKISDFIVSLSKRTDLSLFMQPLWHALFQLLSENVDDECRLQLCAFLGLLIDDEGLCAPLATIFFSNLFEFVSSAVEQQLPEDIYKRIRNLIITFGRSFDLVRAEWQVRDASVVEAIIKKCNIKAYEIGELELEAKPPGKRRRRSSIVRKSITEERSFAKSHQSISEERVQLVAEKQLDSLRVKPKTVFKGDPIEKLRGVITARQWDEAKLGLEILVLPKYAKQRTAEDFEEFIMEMIKIVSRNVMPIKADIRNALAVLPIRSELALALLARCSTEPEEKRARGKAVEPASRQIFFEEDENIYLKRLTFALEVLNANMRIQPSSKLFAALFDMLKIGMQNGGAKDHSNHCYVQELVIALLVRLLREPRDYVICKEDLQLERVVDVIRNTHDHITLRSCLSLITAAVHISPSSVLTHMMSVFTFMGAGLLKKDNDLTLEIIEQTLSVLFTAVMEEQNEALEDRLISVSQLLAASLLDMPAHRRLSVVRAVARAAAAEHLATIVAVLFKHYCLNWQRNDSSRGRPTVEMFEELATEIVSLFDGAEQLSCVVDLLEHVVQLGGDFIESNSPDTAQHASKIAQTGYGSIAPKNVIFNRSRHSVQKLRHYRFTIVGWIARLLSGKDLLDKLVGMNDAEMYERLLVIGKRMLVRSVELNELVSSEMEQAEGRGGDISGAPQSNHYNYWIAFASRADILADKLRNVLPANVSARLISDILEDSKTSSKMRDRALHLLNVKLMQDISFVGEGAISTEHLNAFADKLNRWIKPVESKQEVVLCQNAAFSLKLIARRIPADDSAPALSNSVALCSKLLEGWRSLDEAMVGSVLLLVGELVRRQNTRSTLRYVNNLCTISVEVLAEQLEVPQMLSNPAAGEEASTVRRKRIAQQSLSGRRIGGDVLLQCSLACLQRIVDHFAQFISTHLSRVLILLSRTLIRCDPTLSAMDVVSDSNATTRLSAVEHRIVQIRRALTRVEMRLLIEPFREASEQLITSPEATVALFSMLSACLQTKERSELLKYLASVCDQYFTAFDLRVANHSLENYSRVVECEGRLIGYLMRAMDCLSENECRPIVARLSKWAEEAIAKQRADDSALRLTTVFNFFNRFYDSYNALALPHFSRIFEMVPHILQRTNARLADGDSLLFTCKKGSVDAVDMNALIVFTINLVEKCARHDEFFVEERAKLVLDGLINELDNTTVQGHKDRCIPHLADCLLQIADCRNELVAEMINKIMLKTRSISPKVRYCTLLVLERMFDRMSDAVAPLLPSVLPFLSELLEDEKKKVEEQCDKVIALLRNKFGEEITEGYIQY